MNKYCLVGLPAEGGVKGILLYISRTLFSRNRIHSNRPKPLRPETRLNFSSRGRIGGTSSTSPSPLPLDADTSGSADVPVEQKQIEDNAAHQVSDQRPSEVKFFSKSIIRGFFPSQEVISETTLSPAYITTTPSTPAPDALTRLKHRPKIRIGDKGSHAKAQAQQLNHTVTLNQNRRNLVIFTHA